MNSYIFTEIVRQSEIDLSWIAKTIIRHYIKLTSHLLTSQKEDHYHAIPQAD